MSEKTRNGGETPEERTGRTEEPVGNRVRQAGSAAGRGVHRLRQMLKDDRGRQVIASVLLIVGLAALWSVAIGPWRHLTETLDRHSSIAAAPESMAADRSTPADRERAATAVRTESDAQMETVPADGATSVPAETRRAPVERVSLRDIEGGTDGVASRSAAASAQSRAEAVTPAGRRAAVSPSDDVAVARARGWHRHPVYGEWRFQPGLEFAVETGTPVRATWPGIVTFVGQDDRWGLTVRLQHEDGWHTAFGYLQDVNVAQGTSVAPGEEIGRSGLTPWQEPRLFFGVWKDGVAVDPLPLLPVNL